MMEPTSSGRLCERALRAFDRLCEIERQNQENSELTPRQRSRRHLLEARASASEWLVPPMLAATADELIEAANRIEDPILADAWTDHLPIAVLAVLERRGLARRLADGDPFLRLD